MTTNKKYKPKQGDKILLNWLDAFGRGAWCSVEDVEGGLDNPIECEIIGYFIKENKDFIVLSMGLQNDPHSAPFLHLEFIPKGAVKNIKKIT